MLKPSVSKIENTDLFPSLTTLLTHLLTKIDFVFAVFLQPLKAALKGAQNSKKKINFAQNDRAKLKNEVLYFPFLI